MTTRASMGRICILAVALSAGMAAQPPARPNIVVFLADDQGWGDLGITGNTDLNTPRIDSIAHAGAMLRHFYVSPVCAPTRAEFLTGRYYPRGGVYGTSARAERLNLDEKTVADTFKAAGYATGAFGKWHNGSQSPYHPNARGFDEFYGITQGHWGQYFDAPMDHNGMTVRGKGYIADDLTDRAMAFITRHRGRPFLAYIPFNTPHSPMQVPDRFYARFATRELQKRADDPGTENVAMTRAALAMVENIDWNVGRVLDHLDRLGLARNTIVIYFSDNGPAAARWNGGLKGRKGSLDEGGIRSPFLIRWPGRIRSATTISRIASAVDLLPTLADLADIPVVGSKPLDGRSLEPLLLGKPGPWPDRRVFAFGVKGQVSVRTERFRRDPAGRLFDLIADPGQRADVSASHPEIAADLRAAADEMGRSVPVGGAAADDRPLPVGHARRSELPAGDATATGAVQRSNRFPNSSYYTGWTGTDAVVSWDVEVLREAEYEVVLYYACPAADVGSTIEVAFGGRRLTATVAAAHDPPLIGAADDRVPRQESYVKDFRPLALGRLHLPAARGPLTVRATSIPGGQALELWSLVLTRR